MQAQPEEAKLQPRGKHPQLQPRNQQHHKETPVGSQAWVELCVVSQSSARFCCKASHPWACASAKLQIKLILATGGH